MRTANDIAEWIVRYTADGLGAPVDPLSLEKLLYYAQAFHLALQDGALFPDEIEAWKLGPVVPEVYRRYSPFGASPIFPEDNDPAPDVGERVLPFLTQVVEFFGRLTSVSLSTATHLEAPWLEQFEEGHGTPIPQYKLKSYYRSLMKDGEYALSRHEMLDTIPNPRWSSYYVAGICQQKMASHPFYDGGLAKKLAEPVPPGPKLSSEFYAPVKSRDFIEFRDSEDIEEAFRRFAPNA